MSAVTTHVLDAALGRPAVGVPVRLEHISDLTEQVAQKLAVGVTDADGRVGDLGPDRLEIGIYRLTFDTATYFVSTDQTGFYPMISVTFHLIDSSRHYHVPVLLSPFAYSTYQGS